MHAQLTDISVNTAVHVLFLPCAREWAQARLGWTRPGWEGWKVYVSVCVCFKVANLRESRVIAALFRACAQEKQKSKRPDTVRALLFTADENKKKSKPPKLSNTCGTCKNCRALILTSKVDRLQETYNTDKETKIDKLVDNTAARSSYDSNKLLFRYCVCLSNSFCCTGNAVWTRSQLVTPSSRRQSLSLLYLQEKTRKDQIKLQ